MAKRVEKEGGMLISSDWSWGLTREPSHEFGISQVRFWIHVGYKIHHTIRVVGHGKNDAVEMEIENCRHIEKGRGERPHAGKKSIRNRGPKT